MMVKERYGRWFYKKKNIYSVESEGRDFDL